MLPIVRILMILLLFATAGTARAEGEPAGHLVIAGGGTTIAEITRKALDLSGGAAANVLVIPQASAAEDAGSASVAMWREAGAKAAACLDLHDPAAAVAAVKAASLIWIPGGDQNRLMRALERTGVPEAILARYRGGATVGGTSAGAAVVSAVMLTGDADLDSLTAGKTVTATGLGLWPEAIVDQHVLARRRLNRLISVVLDHPALIGVGVDESTALIVSGGRKLEVIGRSDVVVIDARRADAVAAKTGEPCAGLNLRMHVLRAGMSLEVGAP